MEIHDELQEFLIRSEPLAPDLIGDARDRGDDEREGKKHPEKPVGPPDFRRRKAPRPPHPEAGKNEEEEPASENGQKNNRTVCAEPCARVEL